MASSSHARETLLYGTSHNHTTFKLTAKEGMKSTPKPSSSDEAILKNWQIQMVIPFVVDKKMLAFHGALVDKKSSPKTIAPFFHGYKPTMPPILDRSVVLYVIFMEEKSRVFCFMPTHGNKEYLVRLNKVQCKCQDQWRNVGIFDLIQVSRYAQRVNPCMLLVSLYFWEGSANTFQLLYGMLTPTLLDVAAITNLSPLGETFDPTLSIVNTFMFGRASLLNYIEDHHNKDSVEVSDKEHIPFLTLWLSYCVFCPGSLQIAKSYITLAIQIHEG